tara:strand:+ start:1562 stop:2023 length:462 start_codon:yes stop_codon:yes gene_type:complete
MHKINNEMEQEIYEYLNDRFGLSKVLFSSYSWYTGNSSNIYLGPKKVESKLDVSSPGIVALRKSKTYKPTTNFLQLFAPYIKKSVFNISLKETIDFCQGKNIVPNSFDYEHLIPGFVAVAYEKRILGCGHWNGETLTCLIPKSRRTHLSTAIQ